MSRPQIREAREETGITLDPGCSELAWADPASPPADTVEYIAAVLTAIQRGATFALNGW